MTSFITYLKERFNIFVWGALAFFMLMFSKNEISFNKTDGFTYLFLLFFFLITRLYDDLLNTNADRGKPNRSYTEEKHSKTLTFFLIGISAVYILALFFYDSNLANLALIFLVGNHLLYIVLYKIWKFKHFLPLLKYPLIFIALNGQFSIVAISLFLTFVVYEIMDDADFPIAKPYACILTIAAFALLLENLPIKHFILFILLAIASFATVIINKKYFPYIFLLLYLFSRLISLIHEI